MKFEDYTQKVGRKIATANARATQRIVIEGERFVKEEFEMFPKPPIDTGNLRRSIRFDYKGGVKGAVVAGGATIQGVQWVNKKKGTRKNAVVNIGYAKDVEYGNAKMPPRPFLHNGMKRGKPRYNDIIREEHNKL